LSGFRHWESPPKKLISLAAEKHFRSPSTQLRTNGGF
jgi:hypothetical protein